MPKPRRTHLFYESSRVVDDHVACSDTTALVLLGNLTKGIEEKTVAKLHDVGLVNAYDSLSVVLEGEVKGKAGNALCSSSCGDLEGFYDSWNR